MQKILTEWRKYLLNEANLTKYLEARNTIFDWMDKGVKPYSGMRYKDKEPEVVKAAKIVIDNNNKKYWHMVGGEQSKIWKTSVAIASLNASSEAAIGAAAPTGQYLMQLQRDTYEDFKINLPFLDPSAKRVLHPYWRKSGNAKLGAILQTGADVFLDADTVVLLALVVATGGLGAVPGAVGRVFNKLHKIMTLQSANTNAASAFQEATSFLGKILHRAKRAAMAKPYLGRGGKHMLGNKSWLEILALGAEEGFGKIFSGEVVTGLKAIFKKHGF